MKRVLLILGLFTTILSVHAEENVLQTIEIVPVKDSYNIVLVSDKAVDVKKTVKAPNQINLSLKDIRASKTLNTVYNNVSNVDTVMVEPSGNNGINIFFQAENAADASVSFDAITPSATTTVNTNNNAVQNIKLSNPVETYAPIYREDMAQEKTTNFIDKFKNSSAVATVSNSIEENGIGDTANKIFSFGLLGVLFFAVAKLFKRREPEMKIGLSQGFNERDMAMYRGMQPLTNSQMSTEKPFTSVNYGLNAYKRENENPYEAAPIHNPKLRSYVSPAIQQNVITQSIPQTPVATAVKPAIKKHTTPVNTAPVNQSNPNADNLKFLESMTAIYEKSGRHDLAQGLKASLAKNNK